MAKFTDAAAQPNSPYFYSPGVAPDYLPILWDPSTQQPIMPQKGVGADHSPRELVQTAPDEWNWKLPASVPSWPVGYDPMPGATPQAPYQPPTADVSADYNDAKMALTKLGIRLGYE